MAEEHLRAAALFKELANILKAEPAFSPALRARFNAVQKEVLSTLATVPVDGVPPLPTKAPCRWKRRGPEHRNETPYDFIVRVYGPWIRKESEIESLLVLERTLSVKFLRRFDETLYCIFVRWRRRGGIVPDDFFLPTNPQIIDITLRLEGISPGVPGGTKKLARLVSAVRRRTDGLKT